MTDDDSKQQGIGSVQHLELDPGVLQQAAVLAEQIEADVKLLQDGALYAWHAVADAFLRDQEQRQVPVSQRQLLLSLGAMGATEQAQLRRLVEQAIAGADVVASGTPLEHLPVQMLLVFCAAARTFGAEHGAGDSRTLADADHERRVRTFASTAWEAVRGSDAPALDDMPPHLGDEVVMAAQSILRSSDQWRLPLRHRLDGAGLITFAQSVRKQAIDAGVATERVRDCYRYEVDQQALAVQAVDFHNRAALMGPGLGDQLQQFAQWLAELQRHRQQQREVAERAAAFEKVVLVRYCGLTRADAEALDPAERHRVVVVTLDTAQADDREALRQQAVLGEDVLAVLSAHGSEREIAEPTPAAAVRLVLRERDVLVQFARDMVQQLVPAARHVLEQLCVRQDDVRRLCCTCAACGDGAECACYCHRPQVLEARAEVKPADPDAVVQRLLASLQEHTGAGDSQLVAGLRALERRAAAMAVAATFGSSSQQVLLRQAMETGMVAGALEVQQTVQLQRGADSSELWQLRNSIRLLAGRLHVVFTEITPTIWQGILQHLDEAALRAAYDAALGTTTTKTL